MRGDMLLLRHFEIRAELDIELICISHWVIYVLRGGAACQGRCSDFIIHLASPARAAETNEENWHNQIICNSAICVEGKFELPPIFWHMQSLWNCEYTRILFRLQKFVIC